MKKILFTFLILISVVPVLSFAQATTTKLDYSGLVQCDGVVTQGEAGRTKECGFNDLLLTVQHILNWAFYLIIPISVASLAYGGILYMTGVSGKISTAHKIFKSIAIGFIIMLTAWFAVVTVVSWFVKPDSGFDTFISTPSK